MAKNSRIQLVISAKDKAAKVVNRVRATFKSLKKSVFSVKSAVLGLGAAMGTTALAKSFISAASEAENYRVRLNVLLGSQEEGNRLFKQMADYAGQVPYEYSEIMASATQLSGIMKGGVDEITQWMPLIGDLAAASGLGIQQTTEQVSRMLSAGAASADLFRERGITSMLGFQAGVSYSAEETRKQLWSEWSKSGSKFKGTTKEMANTWTGLTSMLKDAWFSFRTAVMDSGVFDGMKKAVQGVLDKITELKKSGKFDELAKGFGDKIMTGMIAILKALPSIVRQAINAAELLLRSISGFKQIKLMAEFLLAKAEVWSLELINGLRGVFLILLRAVDRIPGVDTSKEQSAYEGDIGMAGIRIGTKKRAADAKEQELFTEVRDMQATKSGYEKMAETAAGTITTLMQPAVEALTKSHEEGAQKRIEASQTATEAEVSDINRLIAKYNELNTVKLTGSGGISIVSALADSLDEDDL
jgi:phage tail tape-measure protein